MKKVSAFRRVIALSASLCLSLSLVLGPLSPLVTDANACGPFFDQTIFTTSLHPDLPLRFYAAGQLGLVQPTYARSYLISAYRYLDGKALTSGEQKAMSDLWARRLSGFAGDNDDRAALEWTKNRSAILGVKDKMPVFSDVYRSSGDYDNYLNCPSDAFKTASATLARLVSKYGADSQICKEWIKGQDAVFCHCAGPQYDYKNNKAGVEPGFPEKLPETAAAELRQDRTYQMACAFFYAQKLPDALKLFELIAQDKTSVWQKVATYMVARTQVRLGTLSNPKALDKNALNQALSTLKQLAANPEYKDYAKSVADLINFVEVRLDPARASVRCAQELSKPTDGASTFALADSYLFALDRLFNYDAFGDDQSRKLKVADSAALPVMRSEEMTDWIWCFSSSDASETAHAADKFKLHRNALWAIAYASKLKGSEADVPAVEAVLAKAGKGDAAYVTASYHRARLLLAGGHSKEAEATIAAALAAVPAPSPSAANALNLLRLRLSGSVDDFISLAFLAPALISSGYDSQEMPDNLDKAEKAASYQKIAPVLLPEAAQAFNSTFPLSDFVQAVSSSRLPKSYQGQFAQAAFSRAVILGDFKAAQKVSGALQSAYPQMAPQLQSFNSASSNQDKEFAAVLLILKNPGMRPTVTGGTARGTAIGKIDDYQDNWWSKETIMQSGDRGGAEPEAKANLRPGFLSAADLSTGKSESARVMAAGDAPNYLGKIAIAYAKAHPSDPRIPEALALTVKATHFGSSDEAKTTAVSTQAFQLLHKAYANNPWTKKTPYHY
ncbi:MAG: hypothetical protein KGS72_13925 [Cyanobacteria bacterium REEB67]|nr:hypothetical protein [Cyanobacteria bacterium REEB67]